MYIFMSNNLELFLAKFQLGWSTLATIFFSPVRGIEQLLFCYSLETCSNRIILIDVLGEGGFLWLWHWITLKDLSTSTPGSCLWHNRKRKYKLRWACYILKGLNWKEWWLGVHFSKHPGYKLSTNLWRKICAYLKISLCPNARFLNMLGTR